MKIEIKITEDAAETGITVTCKQLTPEIERMIAMLRMLDRKLTGSKDGELFLLDAGAQRGIQLAQGVSDG